LFVDAVKYNQCDTSVSAVFRLIGIHIVKNVMLTKCDFPVITTADRVSLADSPDNNDVEPGFVSEDKDDSDNAYDDSDF